MQEGGGGEGDGGGGAGGGDGGGDGGGGGGGAGGGGDGGGGDGDGTTQHTIWKFAFVDVCSTALAFQKVLLSEVRTTQPEGKWPQPE